MTDCSFPSAARVWQQPPISALPRVQPSLSHTALRAHVACHVHPVRHYNDKVAGSKNRRTVCKHSTAFAFWYSSENSVTFCSASYLIKSCSQNGARRHEQPDSSAQFGQQKCINICNTYKCQWLAVHSVTTAIPLTAKKQDVVLKCSSTLCVMATNLVRFS